MSVRGFSELCITSMIAFFALISIYLLSYKRAKTSLTRAILIILNQLNCTLITFCFTFCSILFSVILARSKLLSGFSVTITRNNIHINSTFISMCELLKRLSHI
ncbi:hypothetical protein BY458DRAFT_252402 [Sporodiniella umbellata]|nr:hypothetical protein BY458DRAFT_252402 [Sporodiniella umbellata]